LLKKSGMLRGIIFRWKNDKVVNFILVLWEHKALVEKHYH
jgi:hypothetical protein